MVGGGTGEAVCGAPAASAGESMQGLTGLGGGGGGCVLSRHPSDEDEGINFAPPPIKSAYSCGDWCAETPDL